MTEPKRLRWTCTDNPIYFVTASTFRRRWILDRKHVHEAFIQFCLKASDYRVSVGRYVIMPDHIHVFAAFGTDSVTVSSWIKSLKNTISKSLNSLNCTPPHWQKGFFEHVVRSHESYDQKWFYVRENPVRAGLVKNSEDWPYSGEISDLENLDV